MKKSKEKSLRSRKYNRRDIVDKSAMVFLSIVILIVISPFFLIVVDVLINGLIIITPSFLLESPRSMAIEGGIFNAIIGSSMIVGIATVFSLPLSVGGAIFISEYVPSGRIRQIVETSSDILSGVPSIVFGAFGFTFFTRYLRLGINALAGGLTLGLMMIPTVLRTSQEALLAVPNDLREASLALGATKFTTTHRVTLRVAFPAIVTGVMLAIGRVIGETAPLLFTAGFSDYPPNSIFDWAASLPTVIYFYTLSPFDVVNAKAYGTALVLLVMVLAVDLAANYLSSKIGQRVR